MFDNAEPIRFSGMAAPGQDPVVASESDITQRPSSHALSLVPPSADQSVGLGRSQAQQHGSIRRRLVGHQTDCGITPALNADATDAGARERVLHAHLLSALNIDSSVAVAPDVADRIGETVALLLRYGQATPSAVDATLSTAFWHDLVLTSIKAVGTNAVGFTGGLQLNALVLAPKITDVISGRGLFSGAATVTMNTLSGTLGGAMLEPALAAGPERSMPKSVRDRASPLARGFSEAAFAFVHDLLRQAIPALQVLQYPSQTNAVPVAQASRDGVRWDAASRNISAWLNTIRPINAGSFLVGGLYAGEATFNERMLLQPPERLEQWLAGHAGQGVPQALWPTSAGVIRSVSALPEGLAEFCRHLPSLIPQAFMGGFMISLGLLAAAGRAAELPSLPGYPAGTEGRETTLQRRMIFGFCEALLEASLVGMGTVFDQLVASQPVVDGTNWLKDRGAHVTESMMVWSVGCLRTVLRRPIATHDVGISSASPQGNRAPENMV